MFKKGATYAVRTASAFAGKILPDGCVFSHISQTWQHQEIKHLLASIAYMMCRVPQAFVELGVGGGDIATSGSAARRYTTAVIEGVPVKNLEVLADNASQALVRKVLDAKLVELSFDETSADFRNLLINQDGQTLVEITESTKQKMLTAKEEALYASFLIDKLVSDSFGLDAIESEFVDSEVGIHPCSYTENPDDILLESLCSCEEELLIKRAVELHGSKRYFTKKSFFVDRRIEVLSHALQASPRKIIETLKSTLTEFETKEVAKSILSECVGIAFNRWFKTFCSNELRDPFSPLPNISPAAVPMLADDGSISDRNSSEVLVLDEGSSLNLCEIIKKEISSINNESLLDECVTSLGAKDLTQYFSSPNFFFSDHLSRYSKSRRSAPIYWPLQTPSGSYSLWIYYHRLNEETLYTCVNDFVEPKIEQTEQDLNALRSKSARSSQEEKELAKLTDFEAELKDFRDELLRLAKFWKPNLNDGVQVTAAPLWKLFQHKAWQKKLKDTWSKLEKGEYDWAHLACSIWPERVLLKCHQDRSLAIAHGVENIFWHEVEVPVKRGKKLTGETKLEWQPKDLSDSELDALVKQTIAEMN